jgi:two-component system nitrogen regulation sensor histidine kinase GlnL
MMSWWMTGKAQAKSAGLSLTAEALVRNIMLVGFLVMLLLVGAIGYWSAQSFRQFDERINAMHHAETNHLRLVFEIAETEGKISTEARIRIGSRESGLLHFASVQHLKDLKAQMDALIHTGRQSAIASSEEWDQFEKSFNDFWAAIKPGSLPDQNWDAARENLRRAIRGLEDITRREVEENDKQASAISKSARRQITVATIAILALGLVVAGLTFYEIRRILNRLSQAYSESAKARDYLQSLLDSLISGVVVIDQEGKITSMNRSFHRLTGVSLEALGQDYKKVLGDKPVLAQAIASRLESLAHSNCYCCRVELEGNLLFDVYTSPLVIAGEQRGLILVFVDITEVERAQAELRRNRALTAIGQMTAQVAHEIKNPLGSIRFAAEMLKQRLAEDGEKCLEIVDVIERSVCHLANIVNELSEFSRPKQLDRTKINLNNLLDDLLPMVADRLKAKEIRVEKRYAANLPSGNYDPAELRKLFLNLIINAIDASKPGGLIELRTAVNGANRLVVEIVDYGVGMDENTRARLFEPFYTTKERGTGLGMAIAKKITELHQGDLKVVSEPGKGSTITVELPLA